MQPLVTLKLDTLRLCPLPVIKRPVYTMDRHIACFSVPTFSIALARLEDSSLQKRPIAVAISQASQSPIIEASQEALHDGVLPGQLVTQAQRQCPSLHILTPRTADIRKAHHALTNTIRQFSPVWEPIQPGRFFFDLTGTTRLFGAACDTTMRIKREITEQYGKIPSEIKNLILLLKIRIYLQGIGIIKISIKTHSVVIYFDNKFIESNEEIQSSILNFFTQRPKIYKINPDFSIICNFKDRIELLDVFSFAKNIAEQIKKC